MSCLVFITLGSIFCGGTKFKVGVEAGCSGVFGNNIPGLFLINPPRTPIGPVESSTMFAIGFAMTLATSPIVFAMPPTTGIFCIPSPSLLAPLPKILPIAGPAFGIDPRPDCIDRMLPKVLAAGPKFGSSLKTSLKSVVKPEGSGLPVE